MPHRPHRTLSEWDIADPGTVYDPGLFRCEILARLAPVSRKEIAEEAGCSKDYASEIGRNVSTWHHCGTAKTQSSLGQVRQARAGTHRRPLGRDLELRSW